MKIRFYILAAVVALNVVLGTNSKAEIRLFDLQADWSSVANPNGAWSYRLYDGNLLQNHQFPWDTAESWGPVNYITQTTEESVVPDRLELGDISVYAPYGVIVRWTAPAAGIIEISGATWNGTADFALTEWTLTHKESLLSDGNTGFGLRNFPYNLTLGSGGPSALLEIPVNAGDEVDLHLLVSGGAIGLNFSITLTTDSINLVGAIENLAVSVFDMNLQNGIENSLDSKLDAALAALQDANVSNDGAACNSLAAFVSAVEAQRNKKISNAQANQLIAAAQEIRSMLGCAN